MRFLPDTTDKIDFDRMARVVMGIYRVVAEAPEHRNSSIYSTPQ